MKNRNLVLALLLLFFFSNFGINTQYFLHLIRVDFYDSHSSYAPRIALADGIMFLSLNYAYLTISSVVISARKVMGNHLE